MVSMHLERSHVLHPVSQKFPQHWLWNSFSVYLIDDDLLSEKIVKCFLFQCQLPMLDCIHESGNVLIWGCDLGEHCLLCTPCIPHESYGQQFMSVAVSFVHLAYHTRVMVSNSCLCCHLLYAVISVESVSNQRLLTLSILTSYSLQPQY